MLNVFNKEVRQDIQVGNRKISLETGKLARQTAGSVLLSDGETRILCTVTIGKKIVPGFFIPLSVHYLEKAYAIGKIPSGFVKRESKPSDQEVLISRLIDRAIRPLFPKNFNREVQVLCMVLSMDQKTDILSNAILGTSAALSISGLPLTDIVAAVHLSCNASGFVLYGQEESCTEELDLVIAGTAGGTVMVECSAGEKAEPFMIEALHFAHQAIQPLIEGVKLFAQNRAKPVLCAPVQEDETSLIKAHIQKSFDQELRELCAVQDRQKREEALETLCESMVTLFQEDQSLQEKNLGPDEWRMIFFKIWKEYARDFILKNQVRLDGRKPDEIRDISCQVGLLPKSHGSALFTRGYTQALASVTLGGKEDAQLVDGLGGTYRDNFMLHYNFPSFSVGEVGKVGAPGRREIGHGRLAWRALKAAMPKDFPYTIRVVSEILESYGSSSMATVCAGSLALFHAGVPLTRPVAGIAMGLVQENSQEANDSTHKKEVLLSDISGFEDEIGDMDFKIAGTEKGVTALQMDLKGQPLSEAFLKAVLDKAYQGRLHILKIMAQQTIDQKDEPRGQGPVILEVKIPSEKIKDLIGPGGKVIKELCETMGVRIDIKENGLVSVFGPSRELGEKAVERIKGLTEDPEVGSIYEGKIEKIMDYGAFINFGFAQDGLVHISEISSDHVSDIRQSLSEGHSVSVKVIGFDRGRAKLSIKQV